MAAYADSADMVARYAVRLLGDLCADDGTTVSEVNLAANAKMLMALKTASGRIDAAIKQGNRYTAAQIAAMMDSGDAAYDENGTEFLIDLTCRIAFHILWQRKPWSDQANSARKQAESEYRDDLEALRTGREILAIGVAREAGLPEEQQLSAQSTAALWSATPRGRFYPRRD